MQRLVAFAILLLLAGGNAAMRSLRALGDKDLYFFDGDWEALLIANGSSSSERLDGGPADKEEAAAGDKPDDWDLETELTPEEEAALKPGDWTLEDEEWISQNIIDIEGKELTRRQKILVRRAQKRAAREAKRAERTAAREQARQVTEEASLEPSSDESAATAERRLEKVAEVSVFQRRLEQLAVLSNSTALLTIFERRLRETSDPTGLTTVLRRVLEASVVEGIGALLPEEEEEGGIVEESGDGSLGEILSSDEDKILSPGESSSGSESSGGVLLADTVEDDVLEPAEPVVEELGEIKEGDSSDGAIQDELLGDVAFEPIGVLLPDEEGLLGGMGESSGGEALGEAHEEAHEETLGELLADETPTMVPGETPPDGLELIRNTCGFTLDLIVLRDLTSTMGTHMPFLKDKLSSVLEKLHYSFPGSQFGLASFRDKPLSGIGEPDDFCVAFDVGLKSFQNFTSETAWQLDSCGGGGDWLDNQMGAILRLARYANFAPSRERGNRPLLQVVVVLTDSFPHLPPDTAGAVAALNEQIESASSTEGLDSGGYRLWASPSEFSFLFENLAEDFAEDPNLSCLSVEYPSTAAIESMSLETAVVPLFLLSPVARGATDAEDGTNVPAEMRTVVASHAWFSEDPSKFLDGSTGLAEMYRQLAAHVKVPLGLGRLGTQLDGFEEAVLLFVQRLAKDSCPADNLNDDEDEDDDGANDDNESDALIGGDGLGVDEAAREEEGLGHDKDGGAFFDGEGEHVRGAAGGFHAAGGWDGTLRVVWIVASCLVLVTLGITYFFGYQIWLVFLYYFVPFSGGKNVRAADSGRDVTQPITPSKFAY